MEIGRGILCCGAMPVNWVITARHDSKEDLVVIGRECSGSGFHKSASSIVPRLFVLVTEVSIESQGVVVC